MKSRAVIIDTDGGIDDAAAIWWALTDPRIDLIAVTTVRGVVTAREAARNVLLILEAAGQPDIPVAVGADDRVGAAPDMRSAAFIHGEDGLGNTLGDRVAVRAPAAETADQLLKRLIGERDDISIVTLGPLTNLARLVRDVSGSAERVAELVTMGGSATLGGNALPAGEANIAHDPEAAAIVVAANWRKPPLMVGLDVTHRGTFDDSDFTLLTEHRSPAATFLDVPLHFYRTFGSALAVVGCPCHDLLATLALVEPELITRAPVLPLAISTPPGPACGLTVVDFRALVFDRMSGSEQSRPVGFYPWRIALEVDRARFRALARSLFGEGTKATAG